MANIGERPLRRIHIEPVPDPEEAPVQEPSPVIDPDLVPV